MKVLPLDVSNMMKEHKKDSSTGALYEDALFLCVYDKKHDFRIKKNFHYTAWCKEDIRSLLDLERKHIDDLIALRNGMRRKFKLSKRNSLIYIHFPPNYWRLHIHFVSDSHKPSAPQQLYMIDDVIKKLQGDGDYYRKHVVIPNKL